MFQVDCDIDLAQQVIAGFTLADECHELVNIGGDGFGGGLVLGVDEPDVLELGDGGEGLDVLVEEFDEGGHLLFGGDLEVVDFALFEENDVVLVFEGEGVGDCLVEDDEFGGGVGDLEHLPEEVQCLGFWVAVEFDRI